MSWTHICRITSNDTSTVHSTAEEWATANNMDIDAFVASWDGLTEGSIVLDEGGKSVTRTLVYIDGDSRLAHKVAIEEEGYIRGIDRDLVTVELVSTTSYIENVIADPAPPADPVESNPLDEYL